MNNNTQYYLDKLQEEAAELIQAVSKIRRFGPQNKHPERQTTNLEEFIGELEDVLALLACLEGEQLFDLNKSQDNILNKIKSVYKN